MNILVAGLGNVGQKYELTRHNIGFIVLDALASKLGASFSFDKKANALIAFYKLNSETNSQTYNLVLVKPQTFMNLSGTAIAPLYNYYKCERLIVVHDELDLPFGSLNYKETSSTAGHNGLKSINSHLSLPYTKLRFGIGFNILLYPELLSKLISSNIDAYKISEEYTQSYKEKLTNNTKAIMNGSEFKTLALHALKNANKSNHEEVANYVLSNFSKQELVLLQDMMPFVLNALLSLITSPQSTQNKYGINLK
ncbi:aminoacyl-tRNA hydrolase [Helicobacter sp. 11S02629-2]|uniref:aminoacyl-tRNA hydrolase n=1 Tax=Helicobacter sp. 11S02629-2 TaxID=1476195 RepID=UPI000BA790B0|nr:aminoacyl-tRNA hydrolase [Helicobacter sp. 11S02629-2]PAF44395.1 aminoacyl-tRNA hydrolase [Helicobacter sp. 11S02629-2]